MLHWVQYTTRKYYTGRSILHCGDNTTREEVHYIGGGSLQGDEHNTRGGAYHSERGILHGWRISNRGDCTTVLGWRLDPGLVGG